MIIFPIYLLKNIFRQVYLLKFFVHNILLGFINSQEFRCKINLIYFSKKIWHKDSETLILIENISRFNTFFLILWKLKLKIKAF